MYSLPELGESVVEISLRTGPATASHVAWATQGRAIDGTFGVPIGGRLHIGWGRTGACLWAARETLRAWVQAVDDGLPGAAVPVLVIPDLTAMLLLKWADGDPWQARLLAVSAASSGKIGVTPQVPWKEWLALAREARFLCRTTRTVLRYSSPRPSGSGPVTSPAVDPLAGAPANDVGGDPLADRILARLCLLEAIPSELADIALRIEAIQRDTPEGAGCSRLAGLGITFEVVAERLRDAVPTLQEVLRSPQCIRAGRRQTPCIHEELAEQLRGDMP